MESLTILNHVGSDHAGDKLTSLCLRFGYSDHGKFGTRALIAWSAKHQHHCVTATGAAEVIAGALGLKNLGLPLMGVVETIFSESRVGLVMGGDAEVAEHVFASGRSKALRYLRKLHRISIHFVYDVLSREDCKYEHYESGKNTADLFTKPLPIKLHHTHAKIQA